jgi:hypothetical protein
MAGERALLQIEDQTVYGLLRFAEDVAVAYESVDKRMTDRFFEARLLGREVHRDWYVKV